jgi:hypothetical protein
MTPPAISTTVPYQFFGINAPERPQRLGIVVSGSLSEGLDVKLDRETFTEGLAVGSYITIQGQTERKFFGLITDIKLESADRNTRTNPPALDNKLMTQIYTGTAVFGMLHIQPMLTLEKDGTLRPVKTVPTHFTVVYRATSSEVRQIFSSEIASVETTDPHTYRIGSSLEDEKLEININLDKLMERSTAVFGRSGTGKTFLTVPLLASAIKQEVASALIFDMHNDYGANLKADRNRAVPSLKRLPAISRKVVVVTLDEKSSRTRGSNPEFAMQIGYEHITPEDLESLKKILTLSDVQTNALFTFKQRFPKDWLNKIMADDADQDIKNLFDGNKITESTYFAIQRKLGRLLSKLEFLRERTTEDFAQRILGHLTRGDSVVVEFGRYGNDLPAYIFVANYLTRRIHERYVELKEMYEGGSGANPNRLVIVIEEAHKFLEPEVAQHTIFGVIARELRKYNVTLLIVDQRPSQIDSEVMSQIGTRITCALSDERDIGAVFTGIGGAQQLRGVLAALDSKQQALVMGHAVPMPVVVRTTDYETAIQPLQLDIPTMSNVANPKGFRGDDDGLVS